MAIKALLVAVALVTTRAIVIPLMAAAGAATAAETLNALGDCNVAFDTPSANASGAVPIGNGEVGASVWIEPDGDVLLYLAAR